MEEKALLDTAARMCAAARTAPKTKGIDDIVTVVLTGEEKDLLADKMIEFADSVGGDFMPKWYGRDAKNVRKSQAVVLIGTKKNYKGTPQCELCGFEDCKKAKEVNAACGLTNIDLGIAIGSAVKIAADDNVDCRVMLSVGRAAVEMDYLEEKVSWLGIPLSISGKSPFFDR